MKALILNCTLKKSPAESNTAALAKTVAQSLEAHGVSTEMIRLVDKNILPGIKTDEGDGDEWPAIHQKILQSQILIFATPTWVAQPSSEAKRALERMDAMLSEQDDDGRPVAYNKVAGVVVTGNEDGAHHVIGEITNGLIDIGFTVPGQSWTYWNRGPGPGKSFLQSKEGHDWAKSTGKAAASNLVAVAKALQLNPIPAPS